jgi:sporulation protein YqfC
MRKRVVPKKKKVKLTIKEKVADVFEVPSEVITDTPKIIVLGRKKLVVENYKGIVSYDPDKVRLNTGIGVVTILGVGLCISEITTEDVLVEGIINSVKFAETDDIVIA